MARVSIGKKSDNFYLSVEGKYSIIVEVSLNWVAFIKFFLWKHFYDIQVIALLIVFVQFEVMVVGCESSK